ncbi:MAG: hypothetical protein ACOH2I_05490 [Pseudomonas sp.]
MQVQVVGPTIARLEGLRALWFKQMRRLGYRGSALCSDLVDDAYEMWCAATPPPSFPTALPIATKLDRRLAEAYVADKSIPNGSSIAFVLSAGETRVLFLGDAWAEGIVVVLKPLQTTAAEAPTPLKLPNTKQPSSYTLVELSVRKKRRPAFSFRAPIQFH